MERTGTVKEIRANGTWDGPSGTLYKYEIIMEDETYGEYLSKSSSETDEKFPFKLGVAVKYDSFEQNGYPKIKPIREQSGGFGGKSGYKVDSDAINYHVALKEAREIVAMDGWGEHTEMSDKVDYLSDIALSIAGRSKKNIEILRKQ